MKKTSLTILAIMSVLALAGCHRGSVVSSNKNTSNDISSNTEETSDTNSNSKVSSNSENPNNPISRFVQDFSTKQEALDNGNAVTKQICEEGMILLKNRDNALPLSVNNNRVSVFGKNSVKLVYGGSGSAAPSGGERKTIFDSLEEAGFVYNETLKSFYENDKASGSGRSNNPSMERGDGLQTLKTGETPISSYTTAITDSYNSYHDAALVVISRIAGENWDLPRVAADDANRHYLELDDNERDLLRHIGQSGQFEKVILLLNSSNYIDLGFLEERTNSTDYNDFGKYVDAAIVVGSPGAYGIMALGEILNGTVNPSGRTVDTIYTRYNEDPTWQNFGENFESNGDSYLKADGSKTGYYLVEYEESIYSGYRYYETAYHQHDYDRFDYDKSVVYPFGYGLSYTTFEKTVVNSADIDKSDLIPNETFEVKVKVKNTGTVAGKEVVQLYVNPPYNDNGIEKAYKSLVGFAKTKLLAPGEEEIVTLTVDPYDFASFDAEDKNCNAFRGWELEGGIYYFHVADNAHSSAEIITKYLRQNYYQFDRDSVTNYEVKPLFDEVTEHMHNGQKMSRADMNGTFPETITDEERTITSEELAKLKSKASTNDEVYTEMPTTNAHLSINFGELAGLHYDDPKWDQFLNQMTFDEMLKLFNDGCYSTTNINRLGIPKTTSADGPTGIVQFLGEPSVYDCCYYCSECLLAQTFNLELAAKEGNAIGNECLIGNERGDGQSYVSWYAPGVNLHRSPFSGRNTEYYSEDPFISGKFAAQVIKSVQEKGVIAYVKNFALNDQETHRSTNGIATWCDEQAMRELYLKPFEFAVKEGKTRGLMTSFNRIGTEWAGGSYRLVTTILRKEWGFQGSVISSFHTNAYMDSKQMLYAGGDLNLCANQDCMLRTDKKVGEPVNPNDAKDVSLLRRAAHNNLYAIANSCAFKLYLQ